VFKKTKQLPNLSEQNLVDCVSGGTSNGCNGGWTTDAFDYVKAASGVNSQAVYPYTGTKAATCKFVKSNVAGTVSSYSYTSQNNETLLAWNLAWIGPVYTLSMICINCPIGMKLATNDLF
jgi:hypothetical protein